MKIYSHANYNRNYAKTVSLENVRSLERDSGSGKSQIRFSVIVNYVDGKHETFMYLEAEESIKVYKEIIDLLQQ